MQKNLLFAVFFSSLPSVIDAIDSRIREHPSTLTGSRFQPFKRHLLPNPTVAEVVQTYMTYIHRIAIAKGDKDHGPKADLADARFVLRIIRGA